MIVDRVTKRFGDVVALDAVSFEVRSGEVAGFIGPNGAGKSTALRCIVDLARPTDGAISVFGRSLARHPELHRRIGWLPSDMALPARLTARQLVDRCAAQRDGHGSAAALAARFDLALDRPIGDLSRGNRQKVAIVQAFMHDPELLLLDEPTSGLDPLFQQTFQDLVRERTDRGAAVLMSSHALDEVHALADRVLVIRAGRIVADGPASEISARAGQPISVEFRGEIAGVLRQRFDRLVQGTWSPTQLGMRLDGRFTGHLDALVAELARHQLVDLSIGAPELEHAFLDWFEVERPAPAASSPVTARMAAMSGVGR